MELAIVLLALLSVDAILFAFCYRRNKREAQKRMDAALFRHINGPAFVRIDRYGK